MSPSASTGTHGQASAGLPPFPPRPSPRLLLRLLAAFGLSLGLWYAVRHPYSRAVVSLGTRIMSPFADIPADEMVREVDGKFFLDTGLAVDGRAIEKELHLYPVSWNLVLLCTLMGMSSIGRLRKSWPWTLFAFLSLISSHVLFFDIATWAQVAALYQANDVAFQSPAWTEVEIYFVQAYSLTGNLILPFLLYMLIAFAGRPRDARTGKRKGQGFSASPGRNAPCPCGSGRKYKRCCGS